MTDEIQTKCSETERREDEIQTKCIKTEWRGEETELKEEEETGVNPMVVMAAEREDGGDNGVREEYDG